MANIQQSVFESLAITQHELIKSIISSCFICDYGVVTAVSSDKKTVDVKHAVIGTLRTGQELSAYETSTVEVLYPSSSGLTIQYDIAVDDPVLLIGLKDYVKDTTNITVESQSTYMHYDQATLKAIPLAGLDTNAKVKIRQNDKKLSIKNDTKSLYTILDNMATHTKSIATHCNSLATHISTFAGGNVVAIGSPLSTSAAAIPLINADASNISTDASNLTTDISDLAALLEA